MASSVSRVTWGALMIALGLLFPVAFHTVGLGKAFLPMHIPVLLCGFLTDPATGLLVGVLTPLLSALLTGMPALAPPVAQAMMVELGIYGFLAGVLHRRHAVKIYPALLVTMFAGRVAYGALGALFFGLVGLVRIPVLYPVSAGLIASIPGILLQLVIVPPVVYAAERSVAALRRQKAPPEELARQDKR